MPTVPATATAAAQWVLEGSRANTIGRSGQIDLADAASGLTLRNGSRALGIDLPASCRPTETWVRGRDLTAIYEPHDPRQLRITAMWRAIAQPADAAAVDVWELVLSTQTSLLETVASVDVVATAAGSVTPGRWDGSRVDWRTDKTAGPPSCLWIWNHPETLARGPVPQTPGEGLLLAIHPCDAGHLMWTSDSSGHVGIRARLFPRDVEKGVLLRSRVLAATGRVDRDWNTDWVAQVLENFSRSPLVLSG